MGRIAEYTLELLSSSDPQVTFYPTYILAFYLYIYIYGILSGICSDISSGILSGILFGILSVFGSRRAQLRDLQSMVVMRWDPHLAGGEKDILRNITENIIQAWGHTELLDIRSKPGSYPKRYRYSSSHLSHRKSKSWFTQVPVPTSFLADVFSSPFSVDLFHVYDVISFFLAG